MTHRTNPELDSFETALLAELKTAVGQTASATQGRPELFSRLTGRDPGGGTSWSPLRQPPRWPSPCSCLVWGRGPPTQSRGATTARSSSTSPDLRELTASNSPAQARHPGRHQLSTGGQGVCARPIHRSPHARLDPWCRPGHVRGHHSPERGRRGRHVRSVSRHSPHRRRIPGNGRLRHRSRTSQTLPGRGHPLS